MPETKISVEPLHPYINELDRILSSKPHRFRHKEAREALKQLRRVVVLLIQESYEIDEIQRTKRPWWAFWR